MTVPDGRGAGTASGFASRLRGMSERSDDLGRISACRACVAWLPKVVCGRITGRLARFACVASFQATVSCTSRGPSPGLLAGSEPAIDRACSSSFITSTGHSHRLDIVSCISSTYPTREPAAASAPHSAAFSPTFYERMCSCVMPADGTSG